VLVKLATATEFFANLKEPVIFPHPVGKVLQFSVPLFPAENTWKIVL